MSLSGNIRSTSPSIEDEMKYKTSLLLLDADSREYNQVEGLHGVKYVEKHKVQEKSKIEITDHSSSNKFDNSTHVTKENPVLCITSPTCNSKLSLNVQVKSDSNPSQPSSVAPFIVCGAYSAVGRKGKSK